MLMEDLLLDLSENETVIIDNTYKKSYVECIVSLNIELIVHNKLRNEVMQEIVNSADRRVKYLKDTKNLHEIILLQLDRFQEELNIIKSNFLNAYEEWLKNYVDNHLHLLKPQTSTKAVSEQEIILVKDTAPVPDLVEISDVSSDSDLEIVDEIKCGNLRTKICSSSQSNLNDKEENIAPRIDNHSIAKESVAPNIGECVSIAEEDIESKIDNCPRAEINMSPKTDVQEDNSQEDNRTNTKSDNLQKHKLSESKKDKIVSENQGEERRFKRLTDLNLLEKKRKKSIVHSSDSSCSGKSSTRLTHHKRKRKRMKELNNDYYETSDSNNEIEYDKQCDKYLVVSDYEETYIIRESEERIRQQLLESDSSEISDTDGGTDESFEHNSGFKKQKKVSRKIDSNSNDLKIKKCYKSKWSNDEILNFKVSNVEDSIDKNKHNAHRTAGNTSHNIVESITEKKQKEIIEELTLFQTKNGNITDKSTIVSKNLPILNELPVTPYSKSSGRRNIREVIDDQQTAVDTQKANRDEENRLRRLSVRNKQLQNFISSVGTKNENKLILDFDLNTNEQLVTVNKKLFKNLKPHQKEGVKFMWDCCFESVQKAKNTEGSGCILAHCMGLGKTLQVITLVHTVLVNDTIGIKTVMVLCPKNTILNWVDEFDTWLKNVPNKEKIHIYEVTQINKPALRFEKFKIWHENGGVLILSYDMFRRITTHNEKLNSNEIKNKAIYLLNPGADLVVCDEGHLLKNEESILADKIQDIKTKRRIILTGTPLQNNLSEYHFMVHFVKPNLLGTKQEFQNRFTNPITNGQFDNSTFNDVQLMKRRSHVLYTMLKGCVLRKSYSVLTPLLPPKQEYVILIRLSSLQLKMYQYYIDNIAKINAKNLLQNYHIIKQLVSHPKILYLSSKKKIKDRHASRSKVAEDNSNGNYEDNDSRDAWCFKFVENVHLDDICISYKMILLFSVLERCEQEGDKLLVFSQSLYTLDVIQEFLMKIDASNANSNNNSNNSHFHFQGEWKYGYDYFRLDGSLSSEKRNASCKAFNDLSNKRARLFLISAKSGGLGINLTGANRVVVFDPSWNPSTDVQSIARVFRFGQKKPCYIYRFLAVGTLEENIYNRQVTKISLALRVLDEQQIGRHYKDTDLAELYKLEPHINDKPLLGVPRDPVLAKVLSKCKNYIYNYFEHDSLLENKEDEELDEEERKQAWLEYEQEKAIVKKTDTLNKIKGIANKKRRVNGKSSENTENVIPECPPPLLIKNVNNTNGIVDEMIQNESSDSSESDSL